MHPPNKPKEASKPEGTSKASTSREHNVQIPADLQIQIAKMRHSLAQTRYDLSVSKGKGWGDPPGISTGVQNSPLLG